MRLHSKGKEKIREEEVPTTSTTTISDTTTVPTNQSNVSESQALLQDFRQYVFNRNLRMEILNETPYIPYGSTSPTSSEDRPNNLVKEDNNGGEGSSKVKIKSNNNEISNKENNNNETGNKENNNDEIGSKENNNNETGNNPSINSTIPYINTEDFAEQCRINPPNISPEDLENVEKVIEENNLDENSAQQLRRIAALHGLAEAAGAIRQAVGLTIRRTQELNDRLREILKEFNKIVGNNGRRVVSGLFFGGTVIYVFIYSLRTGNLPVGTGQAIAAVLSRGTQHAVRETPNILNNQVVQTGLLGGFIGFLIRNARYFRR